MIKLYLITYFEDGCEEFIEIPAYSEQQAIYIAEMDGIDVVDCECVINKYATG